MKLLDHGKLELIDCMGNDQSIVRSARVSYNGEAGRDLDADKKLINYLYKNGHNTPFESCLTTFIVKAPILVVRQWHRHRSQSFNEVSARYTEVHDEFYIPELSRITHQSKSNKQMSDAVQNENAESIQDLMKKSNAAAFSKYSAILNMGCPRELARSVLPVATYTTMYATANLNNWFKFCGERMHSHAQYEIQVYARAIFQELEELYPIACDSFKFKHPDLEYML